MWKRLNFKWDRRTFKNILKFPLIIFLRIPVTLLFWGIEWVNDRSNFIHNILPGWES
jgi:hypothetical protein